MKKCVGSSSGSFKYSFPSPPSAVGNMANKEIVLGRVMKICPELQLLPKDWRIDITADAEKRIIFKKTSTRERTFDHPTLGGLPPPWILKIVQNIYDKSWAPVYHNRKSGQSTTKDPRYMANNLAYHPNSAPRGLEIAAQTFHNTGFDLNKMQRAEISKENLRHKFEIVYAIDKGDGSLGGMNGGVFVVRIKGLSSRVFVEKRFKPDSITFAIEEIQMLRRVCHSSLTFYNAAFVTPDLRNASVYVEFCDRGSLEDMIKEFSKRGNAYPAPSVPEAFVWHVFTGLCDGLAYLQGGESFYRNPNAKSRSDWVPILHRDVKPDNVLLRSRHTVGSAKYFYCVLSDFGLACEDRDDRDPNVNQWQRTGAKLGTKPYWAPELLYENIPVANPYAPGAADAWSYYPEPHRHTRFSDLWALGACIYNLCTPSKEGLSHISLVSKPRNLPFDKYFDLKDSRVRDLRVPDQYSPQLRKAVRIATTWNVFRRPSPVRMIAFIEHLMEESNFTQQEKHKPLPEWATKVRDYSKS
jgi:serine/threonine protein kinase